MKRVVLSLTLLLAGRALAMKNPSETAKVTDAAAFGGRYSLHEYAFRGTGKGHIARHGEDRVDMPGLDISCSWKVAWPEKGCGLNAKGLRELRERMMSACFGANFYESENWRQPETIEAVEKDFKARAWEKFRCTGHQDENAHYCSQWTFSANAELTWPFGMEGHGEEWYERPVLCFRNEGYANDGGNGCHSYVTAEVYSLPDGRAFDERDYFRADRMADLFELVLDRLFRDNKLTIADTLERDRAKIRLKPGELSMSVSQEGVTWWVSAYHIFPGCYGVTHVTLPWKDLYRFLKEPEQYHCGKPCDMTYYGANDD